MPQAGTYLELDQDEMEYIDGGIAPVQIVGLAGVVVSVACSIVLYGETIGIYKLNFWTRLSLSITRVVGDITSMVCGVAALKQGLFTGVSKVLQKFGLNWLDSSKVWFMIKGFSTLNHLNNLW